ncbi:SpaA isopeptide-forming pilin-related protein [Actinomycetota bacterium Odt1-20B]
MPTVLPAALRGRRLPQRAGTWGVVLPLLASSIGLGAAPLAHAADTGDGEVKVRVVREVNANKTWDRVLEPGMDQVKVNLTDDAGNTISGTTGADGTVTLKPGEKLKGGKYRVQVINPKPGVLFSAFASEKGLQAGSTEELVSTEEFVDLSHGNEAEMTTAFWNPGDYCQKNADLVTACIRNDNPVGEQDVDTRTLVKFPYNVPTGSWGQRENDVTNLSDKSITGSSLYGIGYSKQKKRIFSGAFARRNAEYGPGKQGAIYVTDRNSGKTSLFTKVPNAGTTEHALGGSNDQDLAFNKAVTKEALGDVEVSPDGKDLYVVNLKDRKLYRYDATKETADAPKASYEIPDPGCADAGDWRPFALGEQDGVWYVGGVCSAESTQDRGDLKAVVQKFDPGTGKFTGKVMEQKLDFPKQVADTIAGCQGPGWFSWSDTWRDQQTPGLPGGATRTCGAGRQAYPQPILADIVFETNGDMVLGFRDRFGDMGGNGVPFKPGGVGGLVNTMSGGDINRACPGADGKFVMDANGGCTNNSSDPRVKEYYDGDQRTVWHPEAAFAGIALSKVEETIASSGIDPSNETYKSGTMFLNRFSGAAAGGKTLTNVFGKGGGMADLEVLCDEAPIQIGNRVWYDVDKDGIQDPGEKPVEGATVNLYDEKGNKVASTKTTARGEYYFDSIDDGLKFNTKYRIAIDNPADYEEGGPLYQWRVTKNDAGTNDFIDSDGKVPAGGKFPEHTITTGSAGQNNHTYDFGYNQPGKGTVKVLKVDAKTKKPLAGAEFQLWRETNGTKGLQRGGDKPDTKVGEPCTTDGQGACKREDLDPGTYYWEETKAPKDDKGKQYPLPKNPVFGPLVLTDDKEKAEVSATVENVRPTITPIKKDEDTDSDANTEDDAVILPDTKEKVLKMDNVNNGTEPLIKIKNGDIVIKGDAKIKDLKCTWPDGTTSTDPAGKEVRWEASFKEDAKTNKAAQLAVGASYKCTAVLYDIKSGVMHGDNFTVEGEGAHSGEPVKGDDPWYGVPIRLIKVDGKTNKPLSGAEFQVWQETNGTSGLQRTGDKPDTKVGSPVTTGADGQAQLKGLKLKMGSTYYWEETKAPKGYKLPKNPVFGPMVLTKDKIVATASITVKNEKPKIITDKKDEATNSAADTEGTAVILPDVKEKTLYMTNTNNGTEPLIKIRNTDVVTKGDAKIKDLKCTWPDGTTSTDPAGKEVRWAASFKEDAKTNKAAQLAVGASYKCTAVLYGTKPGVMHGDDFTVEGEGANSGEPVKDDNPWHGVPVRLIKVDGKSNKPLAGAEFQVWRESNGTAGLQRDGDTKVGSPVTTGADGTAQLKDLKLKMGSTYYWEETKAPSGYKLPRNPVFGPMVLTKDKLVTTAALTVKNVKPKIETDKRDQRTNSAADTAKDKVKLPDTKPQILTIKSTNNGTEPLVKIQQTDVITHGNAKIKNLKCTWPDGSTSLDREGKAVRWEASWKEDARKNPKAQLAVGASFKCTATLYGLKPGQLHTDDTKVTGEGAHSGIPVKDDNPWNGEPPEKPKIITDKRDQATNSAADTAKDKVKLPDTRTQVLTIKSTNNGTEPLVKIQQTDVVTHGDAKIKDLKCTWPDGTTSTDPAGKAVRWAASFKEDAKKNKAAQLAVGASFKCTAVLYNLKPGQLHTDDTKVTGEGANSGIPVKDDNPWNGEPPAKPKIITDKRDQATNSAADTAKDKVKLPDTRTQVLTIKSTNNGTEPLIKIRQSDVVTKGKAKVTNLRCTWPDGTSSFDPAGKSVRWENTFPTDPKSKPKSRFHVGDSFKCTALLTGLRPGELHADVTRVDGEGEHSGIPVHDDNPWHGQPPAKISILKRDAKTGKPLMGAVFELWRESNGIMGWQSDDTRVSGGQATDGKGRTSFKIRDAGTYYLYERSVPGGYKLPKQRAFGPFQITGKSAYNVLVKLANQPHEEQKKK